MNADPPEARQPGRSRGWICAIVALAAVLRLVGLDRVPPALSADEASNAYDGYCLLETQQDRWGEPWPVVLRAFGDADYRPALMAYLNVPCQAILGSAAVVTAARLPSALFGVATVLALYLFARRVFGERVGLLAALLLALCPWHVVMSRLAHESGLTPLFPVLLVLLLERGGVPFDGTNSGRMRWPWMVAAGACAGLSLYTYASAKLFMPALLIVIAVFYRRWLRTQLRTSGGRSALIVAALVALIVAGPMIKVHITDWDKVTARARTESLLHRESNTATALGTIAQQYAAHFGPDWLFITGHSYVDQSPRGVGQLNWYMLPLLLLGVAAMARNWKQNRAYALLLAWLLLYPIASATTKGGVNAARAACGLAVFPLIGAVGLAMLLDYSGRAVRLRATLLAVSIAVILALGARFAYIYFAVHPGDPEVQARYQAEFRAAMDYVRDRRHLFDHIFISDARSVHRHLWHTSEAYIFPLVYLPIEPADFQAMPKVEINPSDQIGFHYVARAGDFTFNISREALEEYGDAFPAARILLIARPGEVEGGQVVQEVFGPAAERGGGPQLCLQLIAFDLASQRPRLTPQPGRDGFEKVNAPRAEVLP